MNNLEETNEEDAKWPDTAVIQFLTLLNERVKKNSSGLLSLKPSDWSDIDREMMVSVGISYGMSKLKGKCSRLKLMYRQFSELISHTGVTYNSLTNTVDACEDTWKKFEKRHSKFKSYKKNGCKHYQLMAEVFARSVATGGLANSSMQMPLNSDEERLAEDEFLRDARPSVTEVPSGNTSSKGKRSLDEMMDLVGSARKSTNKKWRDKLYNAVDNVSSSMTSKEQRRKAREDASMMSTAAVTPYTMKACIEILNNMSGIPRAAMNAAFLKLANVDLREGFIEMSPEWQREWVLSLM